MKKRHWARKRKKRKKRKEKRKKIMCEENKIVSRAREGEGVRTV